MCYRVHDQCAYRRNVAAMVFANRKRSWARQSQEPATEFMTPSNSPESGDISYVAPARRR